MEKYSVTLSNGQKITIEEDASSNEVHIGVDDGSADWWVATMSPRGFLVGNAPGAVEFVGIGLKDSDE